eukprot:3488111-Ditylum_brightwellii.AAC.1
MQFRGTQTLQSAYIATVRFGNEHTVTLSKLSKTLKRGLTRGGDLRRLNEVWFAWSFQANIMFKTVL